MDGNSEFPGGVGSIPVPGFELAVHGEYPQVTS